LCELCTPGQNDGYLTGGKQTMMFSATIDKDMRAVCKKFAKNVRANVLAVSYAHCCLFAAQSRSFENVS